MKRGRLLVAGIALVSAMTAADASAQDCPEWLKWICPDSPSSNQPGQEQEKEFARTKASSNSASDRKTRTTSRAVVDVTTNPKSQQTVPEASRRAKSGRIPAGGDQALARKGEQRGERIAATMNDQEKALFEEFLVWFKEQHPNAAIGR